MVKKEEFKVLSVLVVLLALGIFFAPHIAITGYTQAVAFNQVVSMYYPNTLDISRVVAVPTGKTSHNFIGPYDTTLYATFPEKEINIDNNPSDKYYLDLLFDDTKEVKMPLNALITLPYNTKVSITNNNPQGVIAIFLIDQGYNTAGYAVRTFTEGQTKMIKFILFSLIVICLIIIFRKKKI